MTTAVTHLPKITSPDGDVHRWALDTAAANRARRFEGVVLSDQLKSLDWRARKATRQGHAARDVTEQTLAMMRALLG